MRSPKQQFFLLLAVSLSLSCSQEKAFSRDITDGLGRVDAGSRWLQSYPGYVEILCQRDSSILEMEEGKLDNASEGSETGETGNSSPAALPNHGEGVAGAASGEASDASQANVSERSGDQEGEPQVSEPAERINRSTVQNPEPDDAVQHGQESGRVNDGTPIEIRSADENRPVEIKNADESTSKKDKKKKLIGKKTKAKASLSKDQTEMPAVAPNRITQTEVAKPPTAKTVTEETMLGRLVKELEFGTLLNSIALLNQLVSKYPEDPDYNSLLAMAIRLRDGDVWYQYARKVDVKEDKTPKAQAPVQIMKPTSNETVNELKKSSWFLIRSAKR